MWNCIFKHPRDPCQQHCSQQLDRCGKYEGQAAPKELHTLAFGGIRYLEHGKKIKMVESLVEGVEIDTPEDLLKAQRLWISK